MIYDWGGFAALVYVAGLIFTFFVNNSGPVSPGLALLRAFVWPYWWLTGRPFGWRMPMD